MYSTHLLHRVKNCIAVERTSCSIGWSIRSIPHYWCYRLLQILVWPAVQLYWVCSMYNFTVLCDLLKPVDSNQAQPYSFMDTVWLVANDDTQTKILPQNNKQTVTCLIGLAMAEANSFPLTFTYKSSYIWFTHCLHYEKMVRKICYSLRRNSARFIRFSVYFNLIVIRHLHCCFVLCR